MDKCQQKKNFTLNDAFGIDFQIKHVYNLIDEEGPAHKKQFTVSLVLTSEEVSRVYVFQEESNQDLRDLSELTFVILGS